MSDSIISEYDSEARESLIELAVEVAREDARAADE